MKDQHLVASESKIQIIHVNTPIFKYGDIELFVDSKMYKDLTQFQKDIVKHEKKGATKCFFYSLNTQHDTNMVIYWVRCKFVK